MNWGVITGIGWVTPGGIGWGSRGDRFTPCDGTLPPLARKDVFPEPNQRFGRQSEYSKVGLAAVAFALRDAGLETWSAKRPIGIAAASRLGCLTTDLEYFHTVLPAGGGLPSPNLFAYTLANCFVGEAAIQFGLTGSTVVLNESPADGLSALKMALESIGCGESTAMLAGVCDLPSPPGLGLAAPEVTGSVFLVLEREKDTVGYGVLQLTEDGGLLHQGNETTSFARLISSCLGVKP